MSDQLERAATVVLLRRNVRMRSRSVSASIQEAGSALAALRQLEGLLAELQLDAVVREIESWERQGLRLVTLLDADYPANLRAVHDRPPLLFAAGSLAEADECAVAVIGSRAASAEGRRESCGLARALVGRGFVVVSGLAAGVDTAAHTAALAAGGRTIAVIGTGLHHCYPPQNRSLQAEIANRGAVISRFWPDDPPSRSSFPLRNALMSGLSLASVIVEAGEHSGCRTQARAALAHGRPVFLRRVVLSHAWGRQLAARPGVRLYEEPEELVEIVERLARTETCVS